MTNPIDNSFPWLITQQLLSQLEQSLAQKNIPQAQLVFQQIMMNQATMTAAQMATFTSLQWLMPLPIDPARPADGSNPTPAGRPANWAYMMLHLFVSQLRGSVNDLMQMILEAGQPNQHGKQAHFREKQKAQETYPSAPTASERPQDKASVAVRENQRIPQREPTTSAPAPKNERQMLADMATKLLSINQLVQNHVAQSNKGSQTHTTSPQLHLIAQLSRLIGQVEELKVMVQNQKLPQSQVYLMLAGDRIKETLAALEVAIQHPEMMGKAAEQRLHQDALLLSSLIAGTKTPTETKQPAASSSSVHPASGIEQGKGKGTGKGTGENGVVRNVVMPPMNGSLTTPNSVQPPMAPPAVPTRPGEIKPATAAPISLHAPTNAADLMALIQASLSKGIMQPVPIMVPFPVTFTMEEAISTSSSSSLGKEKTKNDNQGKKGMGGGGKEFSMLTMLLPPGPVIYGDHLDEGRSDEKPVSIEQLDAYLMAATPVTNAQYAAFLSDELSKSTIRIEMPGKIYDTKGHLLANTIEGAPLSQLEIASEGGAVAIRATPGKENHPVVHVTYDGALAYCIANGFRLPSEYEWERAAGMQPTEYGQPLKKLRYGNGSDSISPETAAYKESLEKAPMNMTMPVAFYDGQKVYTKAGKRVETKLSVSPWGCYDMSGNAREWTATSFDEEGFLMITKGGSYADTAFDLRVAAKTPLPRHTSDPYTTFRVAL